MDGQIWALKADSLTNPLIVIVTVTVTDCKNIYRQRYLPRFISTSLASGVMTFSSQRLPRYPTRHLSISSRKCYFHPAFTYVNNSTPSYRINKNIRPTYICVASTYTKKVWGPWTKYKQNANLGNSYCSYKNLHQANTVVSQYLNTYRTFTSNTDWNTTQPD